MALTPTNVTLLANAGRAPRLWSYQSSDLIATIAGANYFAAVAPQMNVGDIIFIRSGDAGLAGSTIYAVVTCDNISAITTGKLSA